MTDPRESSARRSFELRWLDAYATCNARDFSAADFLADFDQVGPYTVLWFRQGRPSHCNCSLGQWGGLQAWARQRIRVPFHSVLVSTARQNLRLTGDERPWSLTLGDLVDALDFASRTDLVLTFSALKSGATTPLSMHFQVAPRHFTLNAQPCALFTWLSSHAQFQRLGTFDDGIRCEVVSDPAYVVALKGEPLPLCKRLYTLALGYDHLQTFNLIIPGRPNGDDVPTVYFIPRRYDGSFRPSTFAGAGFGSWEMGGVLLFAETLRRDYVVTVETIEASLREISPRDRSPEIATIMNVLHSF